MIGPALVVAVQRGKNYAWAARGAVGSGIEAVSDTPNIAENRRSIMAWASTFPFATDAGDISARLQRLRMIAWMIDGVFRVPGTGFRFGLNSLIGLVPFGGDAILGTISLYIVYEAAQLGLPRAQLARMLLNVGLEVFGGSIPLVGDLFDMTLKANLRNLAIIEKHLGVML
jgi:hypothetical protein